MPVVFEQKRRCAMTLAETKEPVKTGKRKVWEWEEEPEVTEWWTRMEERVSGMEERISEVKETVERVERMLTFGVARLLERLDQLEDSFKYEDSEKGAEKKRVEKPEKETEEMVRGSDEEMEGSEESSGSGLEESKEEKEEENGGDVEME